MDQQPAAMQDFDPTYDRCGSDSVIRRCLHNVRFTPESGHPICALIANRCRSPCQNCTDLHVGPFLTARGRHLARVQLCRDPRTVTLEAISEWRKAVEETVSLREAHRCLKIWRALWKVSAAMHYCKRDDDPSLGVRNRAAPGRNLEWTEGEVVRVFKRAWRMGYYGLAAVIAVAWDTQLSPGDVRALRASQMARGAAGDGGILSTRSLAVLTAYLERLGIDLHGEAYIFRNRSGAPYSSDTLGDDFRDVRTAEFGGLERRTIGHDSAAAVRARRLRAGPIRNRSRTRWVTLSLHRTRCLRPMCRSTWPPCAM